MREYQRQKKLFQAARWVRKKRVLAALITLVVVITSVVFLLQDASLFQSRFVEERAIYLPVDEFYQDSEFRFRRFKQSLRTKWELSGWAKSWTKPSIPTLISFQIDRVGPIDEGSNSILISGVIEAEWVQKSSSSLGEDPDPEDIFPKDILEKSTINLTDPSTQEDAYKRLNLYSYEPMCNESVDGKSHLFDCQEKAHVSRYRFSGYFPLQREMHRFPFDSLRWRVAVTLPRRSLEYKIEGGSIQFNLSKKPVGSFLPKSTLCALSTDAYSNKTSEACWHNVVKYIGPPANEDSWYVIPSEDNVEWRTVAQIYGDMRRAPATGFFRYLLPILTITLILVVTDLLSIYRDKDLKDVKLLAPPSVILALIFLQSEYHSAMPQISYLSYLDKIYYLVYAYCICSLIASVAEYRALGSGSKVSKKSILIFILRVRILSALTLVIVPLTLLI